MSEEEKEIEVVDEAIETEQPEVEEAPEQEVEQVAEVKKPTKYQKRIDELTHRQREAERQRDEYYSVAQKVMDENNKLRQQSKSFSSISATEMESRINADIANAKTEYKQAYEDGDADKIVEAQEKMVKAASQTSDLNKMKDYANPKNFEQRELPVVAPPPDQRAVEWAQDNTWFNQDMVMTNAAYAIHDELVKKGITAESANYYEMIDRRMKEEFPSKIGGTSTPKSTDHSTVVTPGGNQTGKSRKVRLTPSQVAVANRLGVPLQEYAKQFAALERN
jgi:hypothetical protein|tara:strand:+ start:202 stop:1035 length:834 start_codon:yes stop_codon:yes gene_type:complete